MRSRPVHRILGDELPQRVAAYYEAADDGRVEDAVDQLSPDVLVALPPPDGHEVDPRRVVRGRAEMRRLLEERGYPPVRHDLLLCVTDGSTCMVEGLMRRRGSGEATNTFVAGFRLGPEARIERYLAYACDPVALPPRDDAGETGDARAAIERYFHALDAGRFEEAANQFSDDVMYCHPPYRHTGMTSNQRVVFTGRAELLAAFRERGKADFHHLVLDFIQRGPNALFELVVEGLPNGRTGGSICSLGLDDEGRIRRYVAFYTEPGVPLR